MSHQLQLTTSCSNEKILIAAYIFITRSVVDIVILMSTVRCCISDVKLRTCEVLNNLLFSTAIASRHLKPSQGTTYTLVSICRKL